MSIANSTQHYHFPLVVGSDRPIFSDYNATMEEIDEKLYTAVSAVTAFTEEISTLQNTTEDHTTRIVNLETFQTEQEGINSANADRFLSIADALTAASDTFKTKFNSISIADAYDPASTYSVGDVVTYLGDRYKCTTAVTSGEPFDADKWQGEDVQTVINGINSDLTSERFYMTPATGSGVANRFTSNFYDKASNLVHIMIVFKCTDVVSQNDFYELPTSIGTSFSGSLILEGLNDEGFMEVSISNNKLHFSSALSDNTGFYKISGTIKVN